MFKEIDQIEFTSRGRLRALDTKTIAIALVIGLIIGASAGYLISSDSKTIAELETQLVDLQINLDTLENECNELQVTLNETQREKTTLSNILDNTADLLETVRVQLTELYNNYVQLQVDYSEIEDQLEGTVSQSSYDTVVSLYDEASVQLSEKDELIQSYISYLDYLEILAPPVPPSEGDSGSSRFLPADRYSSITCIYTYLRDSFTVILSVKEIVRGNAAWAMIDAVNMFNDPPPSGYEYILVNVQIEYYAGPTADTELSMSSWYFDAVSSGGVVYDQLIGVVTPDPAFDVDLYNGGIHEGWIALLVLNTDTEPLLAFERSGSSGYWFKLYS